MKSSRVAWVAGICVLALAMAASAVDPAYNGPMGNAEEPALRPVKWLLRGLHALAYHPAKSFVDGNTKTPVLGTVEVVRGVRRGFVELDESAFKGIIGSVPPRNHHYRTLGTVNSIIESDALLRNVADSLTAYGACTLAADSGAATFTGATWLGQKAIDHFPAQSVEKQDESARHAEEHRQQHKDKQAEALRYVDPVKRARAKYLGDRANANAKPALTGDVVRLAR